MRRKGKPLCRCAAHGRRKCRGVVRGSRFLCSLVQQLHLLHEQFFRSCHSPTSFPPAGVFLRFPRRRGKCHGCALLCISISEMKGGDALQHPEKEGVVLFFLNTLDNAVFARRLGVSVQTLCRLYRGTRRMSRSVRRKALSAVGVTEEEFSFLVSKIA